MKRIKDNTTSLLTLVNLVVDPFNSQVTQMETYPSVEQGNVVGRTIAVERREDLDPHLSMNRVVGKQRLKCPLFNIFPQRFHSLPSSKEEAKKK